MNPKKKSAARFFCWPGGALKHLLLERGSSFETPRNRRYFALSSSFTFRITSKASAT
jgi:hypothetical protein